MRLIFNERALSFSLNGIQQPPYAQKVPIKVENYIDEKGIEFLMNPDLTPQGNVSRRITFQYPKDGGLYFRDDEKLRELALKGKLKLFSV
jgi:hypothetical protein